MTTFSQLVDSLVAETRRHDLRSEIVSYLNQTMREVHFTPDRGNAVMFRENLRENRLVANTPDGYGWEIPDPSVFQAMQAVRYDSAGGVYPPERVPSRALRDQTDYYYRAGSMYHFSGYGGHNAMISVAYYEYPRRLKYYEAALRPAVYDADLGWTYAPAFDSTEELRLAARLFTTNWLLLRWVDVISEGIRAKVYKRLSDTERARTSYSLYSSLRQGLYTSESADLGGFG